jgi:hypothetical protein
MECRVASNSPHSQGECNIKKLHKEERIIVRNYVKQLVLKCAENKIKKIHHQKNFTLLGGAINILTLAASGFLVEQPIENQKFHPTDL